MTKQDVKIGLIVVFVFFAVIALTYGIVQSVESSRDKIMQEGRTAAQKGLLSTDNPYFNDDSSRELWAKGWIDGKTN